MKRVRKGIKGSRRFKSGHRLEHRVLVTRHAADCSRDGVPRRLAVYPARGRGRKFGSGFRQRAILLRNQAKEWEVHYLSGFTAERSVRARLISTLWVQTVLVCEPQYGASRGGAGEARGYRFFPGKILCPSRSCTGEAATKLAGLIAALRAVSPSKEPSRVASLFLSFSELTTYLTLTYTLRQDLLQESDAQQRRWLLALELHSYFIRKLLKKPSFSNSSIKLSSKSC